MPQAGFEPAFPAGKRPQTQAWDHAATGTGIIANTDTLLLHGSLMAVICVF